MSDDNKNGMSDDDNMYGTVEHRPDPNVKPDVPPGLALALVPTGSGASTLARRIGGEIVKNEMVYHCMTCGWSGSLQFDPEEIEALNNDISNYSGPCPGKDKVTGSPCNCMTLVQKDTLFGKDFPSMSDLAARNKRSEARVQAEEFVAVVKESVGDMLTGSTLSQPTIQDPEDAPIGPSDDLPATPDLTKITPR